MCPPCDLLQTLSEAAPAWAWGNQAAASVYTMEEQACPVPLMRIPYDFMLGDGYRRFKGFRIKSDIYALSSA